METSKVSIIIPSYNRSAVIGETLESVIAQTYSNWECIVVDDGSSDSTLDVLKTYALKDQRIQFENRPAHRPKGANACRNHGVTMAKGDYVIFLDSDDLLTEVCIAERVSLFQEHLDLEFLVFRMGSYDGLVFTDSNKQAADSHLGIIKQFVRQEYAWNITGPIWKRSFLKSFPFDERLYRYQDVELHLRVLLSTEATSYQVFQETDCYYRVNESTQLTHISDAFKKKIMQSYHLLVSSIYDHSSKAKRFELHNELIFGYYRMLSKYLNKASAKIFAEGKKTIYRTVQPTPKEKLYFYILTQLILRLKGKKGFFSAKAPIKRYFENL